jgi:hypothetical protein
VRLDQYLDRARFHAVWQRADGNISGHVSALDVTNTKDSEAGPLREALTNANNGDATNITTTGSIDLASALPRADKTLTLQGPGVADVHRSALIREWVGKWQSGTPSA